MTILFLTRRFYPDIGGVEKHVWEISKRLVALGYTISVVTESQNPREKAPLKGIQVVRLPVFTEGKMKKFVIWRWLWSNRQLITEADIIHCHDVFYWYLPFRFLYSRKPIYTTFHGYESYPIKQKAIIVRKISEKLSWGNICIGDFIKKWYGTRPDYVSYGAVDMANGKWHPFGKLRTRMVNGKQESALFFGRLDEQTGVMQYMKAIDIVKKTYPQFKCLVIGDGKYKKIIEKKTKVLEFQKEPEKYFKQYRFAFVSRYLSILEAFAAKRLVFAVYDNAIKEDYLKMAPFSKFMVVAKTPAELAEKIEYFLKNPNQEQALIDEAYSWVKGQSWSKMAELYRKLWEH